MINKKGDKMNITKSDVTKIKKLIGKIYPVVYGKYGNSPHIKIGFNGGSLIHSVDILKLVKADYHFYADENGLTIL